MVLQEDEKVVLIQEFAGGGDLLKFMAKSGGMLSERQAVNLVLQPFLAALHYLHTQVGGWVGSSGGGEGVA